ncbi:MAG: Rne/Rng family ribonuclease [Neisseria sp.]|nr:Rne/Rng family ribonuclease [Neisseria sp.]
MKRMLFNATQAEELRVAIVDGQKLMDLDIETLGKEQRKGNIYKGTITRIEPSLEACFVDYGTDRHGFLPFKEVARSYFQNYEGGRVRIQDVLKEGMTVLVQVEKDERGNKGAALTTFISLAGRYLVLMPNNPRGGGVSRRIDGDERQELKDIINQLEIPHGMSIIARTAGIGRSVEDLQWDLNYLLQLWQAVSDAAAQKNVQPLILQESALVIRAIRDYFRPDIGEILIDTEEVYQKVYQFVSFVMPSNLPRIKRYHDHAPLFSRFQIEHQIETAFSREVALPSGGAIVIDHTEALVSIDVNSARSTRGADVEETAYKTNLEAAEEAARQMRLRDLGGLVVIDFIDMENQRNQRQVENALREALKKDRARVQMGKLSRFGLLELSRQRLQLSLGESTHMSCPRCHGTGFIRGIESSALHILRIIQEEAMKDNTGEVHAQVPVDVATFLLNEKRAELFGLEERLGVPIVLIPNIHLETPHYNVERVRLDDMDENVAPSYKRVEKPEEEPVIRPADKRAATQTEAAVQGITHMRPAPIEQKPSKPSLFACIGAWFKGLLAEEETPAKKDSKPSGKRSHAPAKGRKPQPRRRQNRREQGADNQAAPVQADNKTNRKPERQKPRHTETVVEKASEKPVQAALVAAAAPTETAENANRTPRKPRRSRNPKAETASANEASTPIKVTPETDAGEEQPLVINIGEPLPEVEKERSSSRSSNVRNPRRRGGTRGRIRSAQEIMDNIKYGAIVRNVQMTSRRIAPPPAEQLPVPAPQHLPAVSEQVSAAPVVTPVVTEAAPAPVVVSPQAAPPVMVPDLGDLQLIETRRDLPPVEPETPLPQGKRRSDLPPSAADSEPAQALQQVETKNV